MTVNKQMISPSSILRLFAIVVGGAVIFSDANAFAAVGGHHHPSPADLLWPAVNFVLYVALLFFLLKGKVVAGLQSRSDSVAAAINKASVEIEAAKAELAAVEARMVGLSGEIDRLSTEISVEGEKESTQLLDDAKQRAKRIVEQAHKSAEGEVKATQLAIRRELAELVVKRAEELLSREINADADKRLRTAAIQELGSLH